MRCALTRPCSTISDGVFSGHDSGHNVEPPRRGNCNPVEFLERRWDVVSGLHQSVARVVRPGAKLRLTDALHRLRATGAGGSCTVLPAEAHTDLSASLPAVAGGGQRVLLQWV